MGRKLLNNADFVRAYMESYQKMSITDFAIKLGYADRSSGGNISTRARRLRKNGVNLPPWSYKERTDLQDKNSIDYLNSIVAAHKIVDGHSGLKKPPII